MRLTRYALDQLAPECTAFGTPTFYLVALAALWRLTGTGIWAPMLLALVLTEILCGAFKLAHPTPRPVPRPAKGLLGRYDAGSFPSIHTARAACFGTALHLLHPDPVLSPLALLAACAVAWSRVELRHHHLRDVLGGALAGAAIAFVTVSAW